MTYKNKLIRNTLISYMVIIVAFVIIRMLSAFHLLDFMGLWAEYVFNIVVQIGLLLCTSIFLFSALNKKRSAETAQFFGFRKISFKAILMCMGIGAMVFLLNIFVATFFSIILQLLGYNYMPGETITNYPIYLLVTNVIFTAILPGVCEEVAHRGLLMRGLSPLSIKKAIIISAVLFGLVHMNIEQFFYATIIGLFIGYLAYTCDSIYPAIIVHFMNNFLSVYIGFSQANNLFVGKVYSLFISSLTGNFFLGMIVALLTCLLLVWGLYSLTRTLQKTLRKQAINEIQQAVLKEVIRSEYIEKVEKSKQEVADDNNLKLKESQLQSQSKVELNLNYVSEIEQELMGEEGDFKLSLTNKILLISIFVLLGGVTLFTYIWGLIC